MLDRREYVSNEGPRSEPASTTPEPSRALQTYVNHETGVALPVPPEGTDYAELFARLQKLIDNATQTIRDLRRENADLNGRVAQLDSYIHMRAESADNEEELQKSAARLEELLTLQAALPTPPVSEPRPTPAPPTPLRAYEPAPPAAPAPTMPAPELRREPTPPVTNGYAPLRDTTPFTVPPMSPSVPSAPPPMTAPAAPTFSASLPVPHIEAPRVEVSPPVMPTATATATLPPAPVVSPPPVVEPMTREEVRELPDARMEPQMPIPAAPPAPVAVAVAPAVAPAREPTTALAPLPTRRPVPAPASGNEKVAGTYTLVVYPFTRFSDLGQFQSMLQELVGIHDVQVRRFAQGTLEMRLGYDGVTPLPQALHNLSIGIEDVEEEEPYRLRVRLDLNHAS